MSLDGMNASVSEGRTEQIFHCDSSSLVEVVQLIQVARAYANRACGQARRLLACTVRVPDHKEPLDWTSESTTPPSGLSLHRTMLSTQHDSSIDQRRQLHRRQQSLETPILAQHSVASTRQQHGHRRGMSLDQRAIVRPTSIVPRSPPQSNGTPPPFRQYQTGLQHYTQEAQQQRPSQPGQGQLTFATHLQQQLNGNAMPVDGAEEAKQKLLEHISWFQATYSEPVASITATAPASQAYAFAAQPSSPSQLSVDLSQRVIVQGQAHTVPNTPQRREVIVRVPMTESKHNRSQSFQYDVAPLSASTMRDIFDCTSLVTQSSRPPSAHDTVIGAYEMLGGDQSYASSMYSSSIADPLSPSGQYSASVLPTLEEEPLGNLNQALHDLTSNAFLDEDDLLRAPQPYSPRQAALIALGDINASIEETGVSQEQVNQFMSEQDDGDCKWTCLFPECGKKFGRKENIRAHVQTHLGDRQFKCNDCGKCFVRQHDLKRHAKIHSGVKPNVCPCGMSFARQDALTRHRQRGTCHGVLPGFEKSEESKKKRGRPRKERPDLESRIDKATRSRRLDAARLTQASPSATAGAHRMSGDELAAIMSAAINQSSHYDGSSESGISDHGSPFTPAPSSEMDELLFNDFVTDESQSNVPFTMRPEGSWLVDTPPTSPASYHMLPKTIAPAMLSDNGSNDGSSPASMDDVELALMAWRGEEQQSVVF